MHESHQTDRCGFVIQPVRICTSQETIVMKKNWLTCTNTLLTKSRVLQCRSDALWLFPEWLVSQRYSYPAERLPRLKMLLLEEMMAVCGLVWNHSSSMYYQVLLIMQKHPVIVNSWVASSQSGRLTSRCDQSGTFPGTNRASACQ